MKFSELFRILSGHGWKVVRQSGSHVVLGHPDKDRHLIVPNHGSKEVKKGLLRAILKQADIKTMKR